MRTVSIQALNLTHSLTAVAAAARRLRAMGLAAFAPACALAPSLPPLQLDACMPPLITRAARSATQRTACWPRRTAGQMLSSSLEALKAILLPVPSAFAPRQRRNADVLSSFLIGKVHRGGRRARRASLSSVGRSQTSAPIFWCTALRCISCLYLRECNGAQLALFTPHEARLASP